jgi:hypothetical protein
MALSTPLSYDMTVRLTPNGEIDISYANLYMRDNNGRWGKSEAFGFYDYNKAVSDITAKILAIANDQAEFERWEKAAMADIKFVFAIMKNFTGLAFGDFIEKYAKGSVFNISGPLSDVKESGKTIDGTTYKYIVTLTQKLSEENSNYYNLQFHGFPQCNLAPPCLYLLICYLLPLQGVGKGKKSRRGSSLNAINPYLR